MQQPAPSSVAAPAPSVEQTTFRPGSSAAGVLSDMEPGAEVGRWVWTDGVSSCLMLCQLVDATDKYAVDFALRHGLYDPDEDRPAPGVYLRVQDDDRQGDADWYGPYPDEADARNKAQILVLEGEMEAEGLAPTVEEIAHHTYWSEDNDEALIRGVVDALTAYREGCLLVRSNGDFHWSTGGSFLEGGRWFRITIPHGGHTEVTARIALKAKLDAEVEIMAREAAELDGEDLELDDDDTFRELPPWWTDFQVDADGVRLDPEGEQGKWFGSFIVSTEIGEIYVQAGVLPQHQGTADALDSSRGLEGVWTVGDLDGWAPTDLVKLAGDPRFEEAYRAVLDTIAPEVLAYWRKS